MIMILRIPPTTDLTRFEVDQYRKKPPVFRKISLKAGG